MYDCNVVSSPARVCMNEISLGGSQKMSVQRKHLRLLFAYDQKGIETCPERSADVLEMIELGKTRVNRFPSPPADA